MDTRRKLIILPDAARYDASCKVSVAKVLPDHLRKDGDSAPLRRQVRRRERVAAGARQSELLS